MTSFFSGRSHRRKSSNRSSSSDASEDEETESRRESSTNLSTIASSLLRRRRDSSDDDDRGFGGRERRGFGPFEGGTMLDDVAEQDASCNQDAEANNGCGQSGEGEGKSPSDHCSLNNSTMRYNARRTINLAGSGQKITNEIGFRSHSAESQSLSFLGVSSSRGSSARSSCSSLSNIYRLRPLGHRGVRRTVRNSSSTRSDTRLVLRCHVTDVQQKMNNEQVMSSSMSLDPEVTTSADYYVVNNGLKDSYRLHSSLPRQKRSGLGGSIGPREPHPGEPPGSTLPLNGLNEALKAISYESLAATKRSNLSLVSSTCSASKFVVDPVNELPPSPCLPPLPESASRESPLNAYRYTFDPKFTMISSDDRKSSNIGVLTRLNNLKNASLANRGALSNGHITKDNIIRKVKHRDCCVVM